MLSQNIVGVFENAVIKELGKVRAIATSLKDDTLLEQIDNILSSSNKISKIANLEQEGRFLKIKSVCNTSKRTINPDKVKISVHSRLILDLLDTLNEFDEILNQNESYMISKRNAIYLIECMNAVTEIAITSDTQKLEKIINDIKNARLQKGRKKRNDKFAVIKENIFNEILKISKCENCTKTKAFAIYYDKNHEFYEKKYEHNKVKGWKEDCKKKEIYSIKASYDDIRKIKEKLLNNKE